MTTYTIKTETADLLRSVAPKLGLKASDTREIVAPGIELIELPPFVSAAFDQFRKEKKISADVAVQRIIKGLL